MNTATNQGDVAITLNGDDVVLRYALRAAKEVTATFGSYSEAWRRVAAFNHDAFVSIVAAGLNKTPKEIEDAVFRNGLPDLVNPLTEYIARLSNGGKAAVDGEAS